MDNYFKGKKVAIPGGSGFLGSHVVSLLRKKKVRPNIPRSRDYDFRQKSACRKYFQKVKPDIVINCAAFQGGIGFHSGKQAQLFMDNMLMGCYLLQAAQESGVEKFVNIVAGCAYPGYLEKDVLDEKDFWSGELHDSIFSYGFPRKASIVYGKALSMQYGFNSIHLVLANMYGPRDHFNPEKSKALAALIRKIYEAKKEGKKEVEIWGTGKPTRDWLYVKDGADAVIKAAETYNSIEPVNVATGSGVSIKELAETIKQAVGYKGRFRYNTEKPDGAMKKVFGVDKMKERLDWEPKTDIKKGIKETVEWFHENYQKATQK